MDLNFAKTYVVPTICKNFPDLVKTIDRSLLSVGPVTHLTLLIMVIIVQGHHKNLQFRLIWAPDTPVILGMPWFTTQDAHICWQKGTLHYSSGYCQLSCLPGSENQTSTL